MNIVAREARKRSLCSKRSQAQLSSVLMEGESRYWGAGGATRGSASVPPQDPEKGFPLRRSPTGTAARSGTSSRPEGSEGSWGPRPWERRESSRHSGLSGDAGSVGRQVQPAGLAWKGSASGRLAPQSHLVPTPSPAKSSFRSWRSDSPALWGWCELRFKGCVPSSCLTYTPRMAAVTFHRSTIWPPAAAAPTQLASSPQPH